MTTISQGVAPRRGVDVFDAWLGRYNFWWSAGLCAAAVLALWAPFLRRGFWIDETGTFWMAHEGAKAAIGKCLHWPGQSILYGILASFFCTQGSQKEWLLRLPSVAGIIVAAVYLYRLAEELFGRGAGFLAALPFLCAPLTVAKAIDARPYALALAASTGATWQLHRWIGSKRPSALLLYCAFIALTAYLHYFFLLILAVHFGYVLLAREKRTIGVFLGVVPAVVVVSLLPLRNHLLPLLRHPVNLSFVARPNVLQLAHFCFPERALAGMVVAGGLAWAVSRGGWKPARMAGRTWAFLGIWLLLGPVLCFLVARFSTHRVFVVRYMLFATPAFFLLAAYVLSGFRRASARALAQGAILAVAAVLVPNWLLRPNNPPGEMWEWRSPLALASEWSAGGDLPMFVRSAYAESDDLGWRAGPVPGSYLFSQLTAYPVQNRILPMPWSLTPEVKQYVLATVRREFPAGGRFLLLADDPGLLKWMSSKLVGLGFRHDERCFTRACLVLFQKD